ncbi:flagellar FlbD family protein [Paenibacillus sp. GD4]|jgi:flagellar protein FlbD|uniref:flagellar FlbD family protein n=1 Tax=Paenibacillus TaxID=44249 RepID=UPI0025433B26|nr:MULTISPECIES: flagellar FlbD family protein [Paenibacillus]MDQ1913315.1 flagellar FlbD family protein [Paenibacillus sp. GD4]
MVTLTRLNGKKLVINALLIESIEETPDTMVTLITGKKIMVLESTEEAVQLIQSYCQSIGLVAGTFKSLNSEGS